VARPKEQETKSVEIRRLQTRLQKEDERGLKLRQRLRATEDRVLGFVQDINGMLESHEHVFENNPQFQKIWAEFFNKKQIV
jgi:hypothetical protein